MIKNIHSNKMYDKIDTKYLTKMVFVDAWDCSDAYWTTKAVDSATTANGTTITRMDSGSIKMVNPNGKTVLIMGTIYNWGKMSPIRY